MHAAATSDVKNHNAEAPSSISDRHKPAEDLGRAYEAWFRSYVEQSGTRNLGVYSPICGSPAGGALAVRFGNKVDKPEAHSRIRGLLKRFRFFPDTEVPALRWFTSDSEALFNDWVMIGSDLYGAIQQYKIESPSVGTDNETARTTAW